MFYGHVTTEVYAIFGTDNPRLWKCILFSQLIPQGPGSLYYFQDKVHNALEV